MIACLHVLPAPQLRCPSAMGQHFRTSISEIAAQARVCYDFAELAIPALAYVPIHENKTLLIACVHAQPAPQLRFSIAVGQPLRTTISELGAQACVCQSVADLPLTSWTMKNRYVHERPLERRTDACRHWSGDRSA